MNKRTRPLSEHVPLDAEEAVLMENLDAALDNGTLISVMTDEAKTSAEASARATTSPLKTQITTRLAQHDLARLKARALELGMPYQTLLASIVHQYVEGSLVERR